MRSMKIEGARHKITSAFLLCTAENMTPSGCEKIAQSGCTYGCHCNNQRCLLQCENQFSVGFSAPWHCHGQYVGKASADLPSVGG
jgi:hypothetical protein